jgi:hypothetical protein
MVDYPDYTVNEIVMSIGRERRKYTVYWKVCNNELQYLCVTLSKPREYMLNALLEKFSERKTLRIFENDVMIYERVPKGYNSKIINIKTTDIYDSIEHCMQETGLRRRQVMAHLSTKGMWRKFKRL